MRIKVSAKNTGTILDYLGYDMSDLPPFKEGKQATYESGVAFIAPWEEPFSGFPEHARRNAIALHNTGEHVHLRSIRPRLDWEMTDDRRRVIKKMEPLLSCSIKMYKSQIYMFVPTDELLFMYTIHKYLEPEQLKYINSLKVFYNVWERETISDYAVMALNKVGQVWVACKANADMLVRCGVHESKIHVIPIPFFDDDPLLELRSYSRKSGPIRFYHIGKWEPRKEQRNIILCFLRAFKPGEAMLMMKVTPIATKLGDYPKSIDHAIHNALEDSIVKSMGWDIHSVKKQGIVVFKNLLTQQQILEMHKYGDVYVTLSRGEGFDMPAFDAKLAGNRILYVPSGGPQDFCGDGDYKVKITGTVPAHTFYDWGQGATYLDYSKGDAVVGFKTLSNAILNGAQIDLDSEFKRLYYQFSSQNVGLKMKKCLEDLYEENQSK